MDVLRDILQSKAGEVARLRSRRAELEVAAAASGPARGFAAALRAPDRVGVIAEHKRRSPSEGWMARDSDAAERCCRYETAGAAALSVLTDERYFGGTIADLRAARAACDLPILRKDFTLDPVQIVEARAAGADAVLLIARALDDGRLRELLDAARDAQVDALVEVHDEGELARALGAGAALIGVNSRDLATFRTDLARVVELAARVPESVTLVGESGVAGPDDVDRLGEAGVHAVLVGSLLMRSEDPDEALRGLVGRPRRRRADEPAVGAA
ncbi:MAG: indole-3-glycerol phosphate synthase TrpC [Gemmatimonadota bacterium]